MLPYERGERFHSSGEPLEVQKRISREVDDEARCASEREGPYRGGLKVTT